LIKSRNNPKSHYGEFGGNGKYNGNDRSPNSHNSSNSNHSSKKSSLVNGNKFYGDFLTLTPRRNKMNEYLQYQQQSHEPYDHMAGRKQQQKHFYQNNTNDNDIDHAEHSYLNSLDTLKLDEDHNILHSKLFYQNDSGSGNEYVIANSNQQKKQHVITTTIPTNIVTPPNQFNDSNINRFIKL